MLYQLPRNFGCNTFELSRTPKDLLAGKNAGGKGFGRGADRESEAARAGKSSSRNDLARRADVRRTIPRSRDIRRVFRQVRLQHLVPASLFGDRQAEGIEVLDFPRF